MRRPRLPFISPSSDRRGPRYCWTRSAVRAYDATIVSETILLLGETESDQRFRDIVEHRLEVARGRGLEEAAVRCRRTGLQLSIAGAVAPQSDCVDDVIAVGGQVAADVCQASVQVALGRRRAGRSADFPVGQEAETSQMG